MKLEKEIGDLLRRKGLTIAIAESLTGGMICDRVTNVPGSSDYFMGGIVAYSNDSKVRHLGVPKEKIEKYGAASKEVARSMAHGVRQAFSTNIGLSTTGIAGPTGGTPKKPVGLVFIGLAKGKKTYVRRLNLKGTRREIKEKTSENALRFLIEFIDERE